MRDLRTCAQWKRKLDFAMTLLSGAGALVIYLLTLSTGAFPGVSALLVATYTGIEPVIAPAHPIWGFLVKTLAGSGAGSVALRLNLFSAVCGAVAVAALYRLVSRLVHASIDEAHDTAEQAVRASVLAGLVAAAAAAFSVPLWMASTRLYFQTFDLMLLLLVTHLFAAYVRTRRDWVGALFALCYGIGIVETAIFIPFAPLFVFYAFLFWHRNGAIRMGRVFLFGLLAVLGLGLYLFSAWDFCRTADISLRGYTGYWEVVQTMLRDEARTLNAFRSQLGWMLVVVPWLASLLIAGRALNENRRWSHYAFHLVMTGLVFAMLGNAAASPWAVQRSGGVLPVTLYALTAMVAGYLAAYWYLLMANRRLMKVRDVREPRVRVGVWLGYALTWPVILFVAAAAMVNGFEASGRRGAFADACAREMLDHLQGRRWLASDGLLDYHLRLEARRRGMDIELLALHKNDNVIYLRQLKKLIDTDPEFDGLDRVRLRNSADLGVMTFVQDWMAVASNLPPRLAVVSAPDLLVGAGLAVVPNYLCFVGVPDRTVLKDAPLSADHAPFWDRMERLLPKSRRLRDPITAYRNTLRRQVGFVANNMGVLLEDLERPDEAYAVYKRVRRIDSENISALLNMAEMLNRDPDFRPGEKDQVEQDLKDFVASMPGRLPVWSLSRVFGYVRSPQLFAQLGWTWALSGQPGMAMAGLRQAAAITRTDASRTRVKQAMADILMQQNEDEQSEAIYEDILRAEPQNQRALISMARIATRRGSLEKAREWIEKAQEAGVDRTALAIERAALLLSASNPEQARVTLTELTEIQPKNLQAWGMLAVAVLQMNDTADVEKRILPRMESIVGTPDNYLVQVTRGHLAYRKGEDHYLTARDAFQRASALRPGLPVLLEWILRLDFLMDDKPNAEKHARQILRINRDHGFANYIMGSIMLGAGRKAEAEDYLRRSVGASKSAAALNDLAELLRQSGNYDEAERQAKAAIQLSPDLYFAWDTLGGVLAETRRYDEAEQAFEKALGLFQDDLRVHLNLAQLMKDKGNLVKAREIVNRILPRKAELPAPEQEHLTRLARELTPRM